MSQEFQSELDKLQAAVDGLKAQRAILGDAIVEPALLSLYEKMASLEARRAAEQSSRFFSTEERRIVTILFADIVGSTTLAEKMDPEAWSEIVASVHATSGKWVMEWQGNVMQYLGDGLLAIFGIDQPTESDPENAIHAALQIQKEVAFLNTSQPVQIRIGIHTGLVLLGDLDLAAKRELTAVGDAMNTAARLQGLAPAGGILISKDTYQYVRGLFELTPQEPVRLKGKTEPLQTYLVLRAFPARFRVVNRGVIGMESELVGRQFELERLRSAFDHLRRSGSGGWAQLIGSPGIGKSRLLLEFKHEVESYGEQVTLIKARAHKGDERRAFSFMRRLIFDVFGIVEGVSMSEAEERFVRLVRSTAQQSAGNYPIDEREIEGAVHALGFLAGLQFADSPHLAGKRHDPTQLKGQAFVLARQLFTILRGTRPIVVLLEDLQWMDSASWDFISDVLLNEDLAWFGEARKPVRPEYGVFVLATARPEWPVPDALANNPGYLLFELQPLAQGAAILLVEKLLSQIDNVPAEVLGEIVERAEGVPYYVEELINWLVDRGVIDVQSQPWRFDQSRWRHLPLPDTLHHLLLTRLNLAPRAEQMVIKCGSVFGRHFWEHGVESLGADSVHEMLIQAQVRGIVVREKNSKFQYEQEWSFYHNLIREAAYSSLLLRERKELHRGAAEWLHEQAQKSNRLDEMAGVLADHYDQAGLANKASEWYLVAGREAKARAAFIEARQLLDRALSLADPRELQQCVDILLERNEVLGIIGDVDARHADDEALIALAQTMQDDRLLAIANQRLGYSKTKTWDQRGSLEAFETSLAAARRIGDQDTAAVTMSISALIRLRLGDMDGARVAIEGALALIDTCQDEISIAQVITNASACCAETGNLSRAVELAQQQVEITHRLSNLAGEAFGLLNLGYLYLQLGLYQEGLEALAQSFYRAETIGARHTSAHARLNLALANWRLGQNAAARQILEELLPVTEGLGDMFGFAVCHTYLGLAYETEEDYAAARQHYEKASQDLRTLGMQGYLNDALAGLVRCAMNQEDQQTVNQTMDELWAYLEQEHGLGLEFPQLAFLTCARACAWLGQQDQSGVVIERAYHTLQQRAQKISETNWRSMYLEAIPEHREVVAVYEQYQDQKSTMKEK
jgi:class 3 adenylate cyclase/tetratricopeptide (TPR) repeat protein